MIKLRIKLRRIKTGTPGRKNSNTIDFSFMEKERGDEKKIPFSFMTEKIDIEQVPCYLTYTTEKTKEIIEKNLHRSPLYTGVIESVGARYCPSIEDKVVKFSDKEKQEILMSYRLAFRKKGFVNWPAHLQTGRKHYCR